MIPDEEIERVREAADIVAIIGEYVPLKGRGGNYRGPCPFHQGVNRNFSVSTTKGKFYHCFVCKESGDVFTFLQKRLGVDWPTAVRMVAEKSGIELREVSSRREGPDPREPLWEANAAAQQYFQRVLWEDALGAPARDYLASRDIPRTVADRFGLGYAPREIGLMRAYLASIGIDDARMLEAGLLARREENEEPRPRFRARLIFPIHDVSGRVAGFGGRLLGPGEPKYLNTAESPVFSKGDLLYNLNEARNAIRKANRVIVVEGYFDVIRLAAAGIENVVAPLGTALTDEHANKLQRYSKQVVVLYDADPPGLRATFRAAKVLLRHRMSVSVATLPEGEDPDTLVRTKGRAGIDPFLRDGMDVLERQIQLLQRGGMFADAARRRQAIDKLVPTIQATTDPLLKDVYISRASEVSSVSRENLQRVVDEFAGEGQRREAPGAPSSAPTSLQGAEPVRPTVGPRVGATRLAAIDRTETTLLMALVRAPESLEMVMERIGASDFKDPAMQRIFEGMVRAPSPLSILAVSEVLSAADNRVLSAILESSEQIAEVEKTLRACVAKLQERRLQARNAEIDRQMKTATPAEQSALLAEKRENQKEFSDLFAFRVEGRL